MKFWNFSHATVSHAAVGWVAFVMSCGSANAMLLAGVDFEGATQSDFDRNPDDAIPGDGITVSSGNAPQQLDGWTLIRRSDGATFNGLLRNDAGARNAGATTPNFPARLEGNTDGSWSITIDPSKNINLDRIVFDVRGATGGTGRDGQFRTSLEDPNDYLWEDFNLPGRNAANSGWQNIDLDLTSDSKYQGLSGQTIDFIWGTPAGAIDLDTIQVFGSIVPEPSSVLLSVFGVLGLMMGRRR